MFGLQSLDVTIGLLTVYLSVALACTAIVEMIAKLRNVRSKNLEAALQEILACHISNASGQAKTQNSGGEQTSFIDKFYAHPLVQSLSKGLKGRPSYIPPEIFSAVVCNLLKGDTDKSITAAINDLPDSRVKSLLQALYHEAKGSEDEFLKVLETHFDRVMDRASGWVKSHQQMVVLLVSTVLVTTGNIDTFSIIGTLSSNSEIRGQVVLAVSGMGGTAAKPDGSDQQAAEAVKLIQASGLSLGWETEKLDSKSALSFWISKISGLTLSIFAVSLGAPFWFETLQKLINIRQTGIPPREK